MLCRYQINALWLGLAGVIPGMCCLYLSLVAWLGHVFAPATAVKSLMMGLLDCTRDWFIGFCFLTVIG